MREREIVIDLITYSAVSRFGRAQQLNTLKYNVRRRAGVGGVFMRQKHQGRGEAACEDAANRWYVKET